MSIENRIESLERQNRRMKAGFVLMLAIATAAGTLGMTGEDEVPDVVKARAFHVVDYEGNVVAALGRQIFGAGTLILRNKDGDKLVSIGGSLGQNSNDSEPPIENSGYVEISSSKAEKVLFLGSSFDRRSGRINIYSEDQPGPVIIPRPVADSPSR